MVLREVAVGFASLACFVAVVGCARTRPVVAPTVVFIGGVSGPGLSESSGPAELGPSWKAKEEVEVEWKGQWWPAIVLDRRGSRWLVHYEGYGDEWDELVGAERIRERSPEADTSGEDEAPEQADP